MMNTGIVNNLLAYLSILMNRKGAYLNPSYIFLFLSFFFSLPTKGIIILQDLLGINIFLHHFQY